MTPLELADPASFVRTRSDTVDDDSTRVKGVTEIVAQGVAPDGDLIAAVPERPSGTLASPPERRREGLLAEPDLADTVARARPAEPPPPPVEGPNRTPVIAAGVAVALVAVAGIGLLLSRGGEADRPGVTIAAEDVNDVIDAPIAVGPSPVAEISVTDEGDGTHTFTWPSAGDDVEYLIRPDGAASVDRRTETSFRSVATCIEVQVRAATGSLSAVTRGCAP